MDILSQLNSSVMYLICGGIIFFVALVCVFFMVRAYRAGVAIGMDKTKMKRTITASVFCLLCNFWKHTFVSMVRFWQFR